MKPKTTLSFSHSPKNSLKKVFEIFRRKTDFEKILLAEIRGSVSFTILNSKNDKLRSSFLHFGRGTPLQPLLRFFRKPKNSLEKPKRIFCAYCEIFPAKLKRKNSVVAKNLLLAFRAFIVPRPNSFHHLVHVKR